MLGATFIAGSNFCVQRSAVTFFPSQRQIVRARFVVTVHGASVSVRLCQRLLELDATILTPAYSHLG